MDEIDFSLNLPYTDDFFVAIRTMYNSRNRHEIFERLTFCLVGVATPNELIKQQRTTPYNIGKTLHLTDFPWQSDNLQPLITYLSSDSDSAAGELLLERIFYWTSGHPFLTAWMCEQSVEQQLASSQQIDTLAEELFDNITKVSQHPHFERIITFLDDRIDDKLGAYTCYQQLLEGKKIAAQATATHIKLKLAGLVKSSPDGYLEVRNRIYQRIFNLDWVIKSKPQLTLRNLKRFAVAASLVIAVFTAYFFYNMLIVQPPKTMAAALQTQLSQTTDINTATELYQYLVGEKPYPPLLHNPLLGAHLSGFEQPAKVAMDGFWQKIEAAAAKNWFTALANTASEADAKRFFALLSGTIKDPDINRVLRGQKQAAVSAYRDFWQRRAADLETQALQRLADGDIDRALMLGAAAAVKSNGRLHPKLVEVYQQRGYERLYRTIRGNFGGWSRIDFSPDSDLIAMADVNGIYEVTTASVSREMALAGVAVRFSKDGDYLADGASDGMVRVWNLNANNEPLEFSGLDSYAQDLDFSPNNQYLAAAGRNNLAMVWHLATGKVAHRLKLSSDGNSIRFSVDGKKLAVGHSDGAILFDMVTGEKIVDIALNEIPLVMGLDFSPDGKKLAIATWSAGAFIWDIEKNLLLLHLPFDAYLNGIAFSPDGRTIFAGGKIIETNITARLWDAESGKVLYQVKAHTDRIHDVAYASNGKWVATVSVDKTARIWDITNIEAPAPNPLDKISAKDLWQRFQLMLIYTIDENDQVIKLGPSGPRQLDGWDKTLEQ
ncbi:MAG: hypothetical protein ACI8WB_003817 [Phenylobacterium sp.]